MGNRTLKGQWIERKNQGEDEQCDTDGEPCSTHRTCLGFLRHDDDCSKGCKYFNATTKIDESSITILSEERPYYVTAPANVKEWPSFTSKANKRFRSATRIEPARGVLNVRPTN